MASAPKDSSLQVPMILWGAMLVSHILFLVVGHVAHGQDAGGADIEMMSIILTGVGVMAALGSGFAVPLITRDQPYVSALIVRLAFAESATIFGLVLAMLGADVQWTYALTALGVMAHIAAFPTERDREAHEQRRAGSRES